MKTQVLGIIGSNGRMARWFKNHFESSFKKVIGHDLDSKDSLEHFVSSCDLILVSVPISITCRVIESLKPYVKKDQFVFDFTSLKEAPCSALKLLPCHTLGVHPLFGPNTHAFDRFAVAFCETKKTEWQERLKTLFEEKGLGVIELSCKEHDQSMAIIQALSHGLYLTLGSMAQKEKLRQLSELKTPSFSLFYRGLENILEGDSKLYREISFLNPYSASTLKKFHKELGRYIEIIESEDSSGYQELFTKLQKNYSHKEAL